MWFEVFPLSLSKKNKDWGPAYNRGYTLMGHSKGSVFLPVER
jgi:hypothetical protein